MSSIPYSGGTIVDTTFTGDSRDAIATALIAQLVAAGWTSISGSGTDQVLQSASTTQGSNTISMRVYDPGSGNCARVYMRNASGSLVSQAHYLLYGTGKTYRIIACKYNFFCMTAGDSPAREFLCGGTLAVPSFLNGVIIDDLGFIQGNAIADDDVTTGGSFRNYLFADVGHVRHSGLVNGSLVNASDNNNQRGTQRLICRLGSRWATYGHTTAYRWYDDTLRAIEAEIAWGTSSYGDEAKSIGFIHNCIVLSAPYAADDRTITSYDGHAWHGITANNDGYPGSEAPGTLFVART